MTARYYIIMFALCFFVWVVLVDNAVVPDLSRLSQDNGAFTRYRVKKWSKGRKLELVSDELMIYAIVENREQLYYMEYSPTFEHTLKSMGELAPVQLRYVRRFPKFWKRHLYDLRVSNQSILSYSSYALQQKQKENWKFTGIMAGIYLFLVVVGLLNKHRD